MILNWAICPTAQDCDIPEFLNNGWDCAWKPTSLDTDMGQSHYGLSLAWPRWVTTGQSSRNCPLQFHFELASSKYPGMICMLFPSRTVGPIKNNEAWLQPPDPIRGMRAMAPEVPSFTSDRRTGTGILVGVTGGGPTRKCGSVKLHKPWWLQLLNREIGSPLARRTLESPHKVCMPRSPESAPRSIQPDGICTTKTSK